MEAAKATPEEFGLKVRAHPDTLIVTARNKMGSGEKVVVRIGLQNSFIETATLSRQAPVLAANRKAAQALARSLADLGYPASSASQVPGGYLLHKVPVAPVTEFLMGFTNHPGSPLTEPEPVAKYIEDRNDSELAYWDVLLASRQESSGGRSDTSLGRTIHCQQRSAGTRSDSATLRVTNKQRVASRGIEKTGLTAEQIQRAEQDYLERNSSRFANGEKVNFPDLIYRYVRQRPLLIVHLLDMLPEGTIPDGDPVVAWSISFPRTAIPEKRVEYVVNTRWLRENEAVDFDEDEMGGDRD